MTINIYHLYEPSFTIVPHYVIFVVHIQLRGHISLLIILHSSATNVELWDILLSLITAWASDYAESASGGRD